MSLEKARTQLQELKETLGSVLDRVNELEAEFREPERQEEHTNGSSRSALQRINELVAGLADRLTQEEILEGLLEDSQHFSERAILFRMGEGSDFYPWKSIGFEPDALEDLVFVAGDDPISQSFRSSTLQVLTEEPERILPWLAKSPPAPRQAACIPLVFDGFVPVVLYVDTSNSLDVDAIELSSHLTALVVKNHFLTVELERVGSAEFQMVEEPAEAEAKSEVATETATPVEEALEAPQEPPAKPFVDESFYEPSSGWESSPFKDAATSEAKDVHESEPWEPYEKAAPPEGVDSRARTERDATDAESPAPTESAIEAEGLESPEPAEPETEREATVGFSDEGIAREWARPSASEPEFAEPRTEGPAEAAVEPWEEVRQAESEAQVEPHDPEEKAVWRETQEPPVEAEADEPAKEDVEAQPHAAVDAAQPAEPDHGEKTAQPSNVWRETQEPPVEAEAGEPARERVEPQSHASVDAAQPAAPDHGEKTAPPSIAPLPDMENASGFSEEGIAREPEKPPAPAMEQAATREAEPEPTAEKTESDVGVRGAEEEALHNEARRFARLLVSEIKLYNEDSVREGRSRNDLYQRLQRDIERSRNMYEKRVHPSVKGEADYFHGELVRVLAEGDESKFGEGFPGPQSESS